MYILFVQVFASLGNAFNVICTRHVLIVALFVREKQN